MTNYRLADDLVGDGVSLSRGLTLARAVLPYSTVIATDASLANSFTITATDGVAFTISAPTNLVAGKQLTYTIRNTSGGALGAITWNAVFKMTAFTNPATATNRSISFIYDGTNLVEVSRSAADVPN
jgi:hypothetical protein